MRETKEILQILIDSLKKGEKPDWYNYGICGELRNLWKKGYITSEEFHEAYTLIRACKPTKDNEFSRFTEGKYWIGTIAYWWRTMDIIKETRQCRIEYLEQLRDSI